MTYHIYNMVKFQIQRNDKNSRADAFELCTGTEERDKCVGE